MAGLNLRSLNTIKDFFGCGFIRFSKRDNCWKWECRSFNELDNVIVTHFLRYPLQTKKTEDFRLFTSCLSVIKSKHHLSFNGISKILALSYTMNGGKRKYILSDLEKRVFKRFNESNLLRQAQDEEIV